MSPSARFFAFRLFAILFLFPLIALFLYAALIAGYPAAASSAESVSLITPQPPLDGTEPLPPGVTITTVLPNLTDGPVSMAFDPQGRLFFTEKGQTDNIGSVRLYANGTLQTSPVITFSVDGMCSEHGLLGI